MVWRVANFFVTSRQLVGRVGRVEFGERTTRQADNVLKSLLRKKIAEFFTVKFF